MVKITEQLIRKKSEHNECIIGTLEELSLHQEDVEKIEHLNNWCKDLQILYLQSNLISKIENLNKLKKLQYLNLAINNIERVENLEGCESLEKLDLTLNFIGDIESLCLLRSNIHLKYLYLTGNPCSDFESYRNYVIANLPQIEYLDKAEVTRSERIKALQTINETTKIVKECQREYKIFRDEQRERLLRKDQNLDDEEFWKSSSEHAPESRIEICKRAHKSRQKENEDKPIKKSVRLFSKDGRPMNINQAKIDFTFNDENPEKYVLDVVVYKYLDTNLVEVDLQPVVVKVTIKGKIFQLVLPEEIHVDKSNAQRSQTTGHLVITMPKVNYKKPLDFNPKPQEPKTTNRKHKFLEVGERDSSIDFSKIAFKVENIDIPPLEYA